VQTTPLPAPLVAHVLSDYVAPVNIELEAYERRDRKLLLELILTDPFTRSQAQARDLLDAMLALPYHTEVREHYR
jgi:alpha-galactosidase